MEAFVQLRDEPTFCYVYTGYKDGASKQAERTLEVQVLAEVVPSSHRLPSGCWTLIGVRSNIANSVRSSAKPVRSPYLK